MAREWLVFEGTSSATGRLPTTRSYRKCLFCGVKRASCTSRTSLLECLI